MDTKDATSKLSTGFAFGNKHCVRARVQVHVHAYVMHARVHAHARACM